MADRITYAQLYDTVDPYTTFPKEFHQHGTTPVNFLETHQDSFEADDPAMDEFVIGCIKSPSTGRLETNFGDGWTSFDYDGKAKYYVNPGATATSYRQSDPVDLLFVTASWDELEQALEFDKGSLAELLAPHYLCMGTNPAI